MESACHRRIDQAAPSPLRRDGPALLLRLDPGVFANVSKTLAQDDERARWRDEPPLPQPQARASTSGCSTGGSTRAPAPQRGRALAIERSLASSYRTAVT